LNYLDPNTMKQTLTTMWKKTLNTTLDPADGQYYTYGPNGGVGLYGNLTDTVDTSVYYNNSGISFTRTQFVADSATVDNTNGLNPTNIVTLSFKHSVKTSQSHTVSTSYKSSFNISFHANFVVFGILGDLSTRYSFDYEYDASTTTSSSITDTVTTSQTVPISVPKGKIYKALLTASNQEMVVPTVCYTYITGKSETWFKSKVNGHYDWYMNAGDTFQSIHDLKSSAAGDSLSYGADPSNPQNGLIATPGLLYGANVANFAATVVDVTGLTPADITTMEQNMDKFFVDRIVKRILL